jgi:phosphate-selective porin
VLVAYRPSLVSDPILKKLEFVARYDAMFVPLKAPGGDHEQRWTLGVDYWISPAAVFKVAYEIDDKKAGDGANAFFIQLGLGL